MSTESLDIVRVAYEHALPAVLITADVALSAVAVFATIVLIRSSVRRGPRRTAR